VQTSAGDRDDDVGVGGEDIRARHELNITGYSAFYFEQRL